MLSQQMAWANEHSVCLVFDTLFAFNYSQSFRSQSHIDLVHRAVLKLITLADDGSLTNWIEYLPDGQEADERKQNDRRNSVFGADGTSWSIRPQATGRGI